MVISMQESAVKWMTEASTAEKAKAQAQFKASQEAYVTLLKMHGVPEGDDLLNAIPGGLIGEEDAAALANYDALFEGVDLRAFLRDAMSWMARHGGEGKDPGALRATEWFVQDDPVIEVSGDVAVARARRDGGPPLRLVRSQGRWYIDLQALFRVI